MRKARQRVALACLRTTQNGSGINRETNERTGFHFLQPRQATCIQRIARRHHVDHLPADHALHARRACQPRNQIKARGHGFVRRLIGQYFKGKADQRIARQYRGRFVKGFVQGRLATPHIVIIHTWQIIMDQRIAMNTLNRACHANGGRFRCVENFRSCQT